MNMHLEKIKKNLPEGVDGVLITNNRNQRWASGVLFHDGYLLITKKESYLLTDTRYIEMAENEARDLTVMQMSGQRKQMFLELCEKNDVKTLAFEDVWTTVSAYEGLKKTFEGVELVPAGRLLEELREYKDEEEIENIIAAQRIAEQAFDHILGFISPDKTEIDVALELEFFMRAHGAEGLSFDTIAVSGKASALPHGVPRPVKLEKGFFTMDYGCVYKGYCSDMTRTVVIGKADEDMKLLYNTVLNAQVSAEEAIVEGVTGGALDKIARDIIDGSKFKGCFGHSLGHGVGMYIHEAPGVHANADKPLTTGHVITIEPGIYVKGTYGCRIEDMAAFRKDGVQILTDCPKHLIEL